MIVIKAVSFLNSSIDFNQNEINNFIRGSIYFVDKNMNLSILLRDQDINLISFSSKDCINKQ